MRVTSMSGFNSCSSLLRAWATQTNSCQGECGQSDPRRVDCQHAVDISNTSGIFAVFQYVLKTSGWWCCDFKNSFTIPKLRILILCVILLCRCKELVSIRTINVCTSLRPNLYLDTLVTLEDHRRQRIWHVDDVLVNFHGHEVTVSYRYPLFLIWDYGFCCCSSFYYCTWLQSWLV